MNTAKSLGVALAILAGGCLGGVTDHEKDAPPSPFEALLWNSAYPNLTILPYHVEGHEPSDFALDALRQTALDVTGKRGVRVEPSRQLPWEPDAQRNWTVDEFDAIPLEGADFIGMGDSAIVTVVFLDGRYKIDADTEARGAQTNGPGPHSPSRLIVFMDEYGRDVVNDYGLGRPVPLPEPERVERAVLIHEFGHALGLVNCGIPMVTPRERPSDGDWCHTVHRESVMYPWQGDVYPTLDALDDGAFVPYEFDEYDLLDLETFRAQDPGSPRRW